MVNKLFKIIKKITVLGLHRTVRVISHRAHVRLFCSKRIATSFRSVQFKKIAWTTDFTYIAQKIPTELSWHYGYESQKNLLYKKIALQMGTSWDCIPDIKTAWDYSRFTYALSLQPHEFEHLVDDWLESNNYGYGINWLCPMEVAIRAINWIHALSFFHAKLSEPFRQNITRSLYEHMKYLECNWELADGRTSNHYLSDLVGYLYLSWFFNDEKKQRWVIHQIEAEMAWQIFDEGTSYEGSTAYHRLVTELFIHASLMASECGLRFSDAFSCKLERMKQFLGWIDGITIGDDDSGRITGFDLIPCRQQQGTKTYAQFGISVIKKNGWHLSLRHAVYHLRQPSGHFHDDAGSVTLLYDGIPIIVDPGSYCYTPSQQWRNYFRAADMHNKLYTKNSNKIIAQSDMFTLNLPSQQRSENIVINNHIWRMKTRYVSDSDTHDTIDKKVELDALTNSVSIFETASQKSDEQMFANLTFGLAITITKEKSDWLIAYDGRPLLRFYSDLDWQLSDAWVAPEYGKKIKTVRMRAIVDGRKVAYQFVPVGSDV